MKTGGEGYIEHQDIRKFMVGATKSEIENFGAKAPFRKGHILKFEEGVKSQVQGCVVGMSSRGQEKQLTSKISL